MPLVTTEIASKINFVGAAAASRLHLSNSLSPHSHLLQEQLVQGLASQVLAAREKLLEEKQSHMGRGESEAE